MKGLNKITEKINEFLKPFDCECKPGTDFAYYYAYSLITYSFIVPTRDRLEFLDSVNRLNPKVEADMFLWSLLHELGHHETMDFLEDDEAEECVHIKENITENNRKDYYDCIDEVMATTWAVDFANENYSLLENFWKELQPLIFDFYSLNDLR